MSRALQKSEHFAEEVLQDVHVGRFQKSMAGVTAASALLVCAEVYYEHYKGSFGNRLMWSPMVVTPPIVVAAVAGIFSQKAATTALPAASALYMLTGIVGVGMHVRGVARKPGGWKYARYNLVMGPPVIAPGLFAMVGGMGLLAALVRREGKK